MMYELDQIHQLSFANLEVVTKLSLVSCDVEKVFTIICEDFVIG